MKTPKDTRDILAQDVLTEADIRLVLRRLNDPERTESTRDALDENEGNVWKLTPEQIGKGYDWLCAKWKTPRGVERKRTPFGFREKEALVWFDHITLGGFYDAGNGMHSWYVPIYNVMTSEGAGTFGFQYYVAAGQPIIIG